jgi:mannosylglycerate hydrolase
MAEKNHIKSIKVISNTHWDREFRQSFERTRASLLVMVDTLLDILDADTEYHSFTLDGHAILLDDYLEMKPEKRRVIEQHVKSGRIIAGPWYTLAEQFSISHESLVRNLHYGRNTVEKYGGQTGTVAYTPASWGQTGQLPQILKGFDLDKMMFYRGISHHESDAEFLWEAPDGSRALCSRFGLYARYNWYYQVHRPVTRNGKTFGKQYTWGEYDENPVRFSDSLSTNDPSYHLQHPECSFDPSFLEKAIEQMIEAEGEHFMTPVFPAMHGHDISVAHPLESEIIKKAQSLMGDRFRIEHSNLEEYWKEVNDLIDRENLTVLTGERRAYLKSGMWTYLFPATISARTYLKQRDFDAYTRLVYYAEPMAVMAHLAGDGYPFRYFDKGWKYLLSNHTHDANGGCAPDAVCLDMEYRYRKVVDIGDIISEQAMKYIAANISPHAQDKETIRYVVFNPLPFSRDAIVKSDMEIPVQFNAKSIAFEHDQQARVEIQHLYNEKSSVFVDNIWDVPTILESERVMLYAYFKNLPPLGYRSYEVRPVKEIPRHNNSMLRGASTMENEFITTTINGNGTVTIINKETGKAYLNLNYITDQGEAGNAWQHEDLKFDKKINSLGVASKNAVLVSGPLVCTISSEFTLSLPVDYGDGQSRSEVLTDVPVKVEYTLEKNSRYLRVRLFITNNAKDHWLRVNFPTGIRAAKSVADSHFDVVERDIRIPDSTGWVEEARGTHPLRTFVDISDGNEGLSCFTKGIFEYEVFDDSETTMAITLIRSCRIKLKVSEEKITEMPDRGIQCPGEHIFEYAICPHKGDYVTGQLVNLAAEYYTPVRALVSGRGKGNLPTEAFSFSIDNPNLHVTAVKMAEDHSGIIVRMYNTTTSKQEATIRFPYHVKVIKVRIDEKEEDLISEGNAMVRCSLMIKEILTVKVIKCG